jgi:hypothetical protein
MSRARTGTVLPLFAALLACLLVGAVASVAGGSHADNSRIANYRASSALPMTGQGPISAAIGASQRAYWVHGAAAANPSEDLRFRFTNGGVVVGSARSSLRLGLGSVGRADGLALPLAAAQAIERIQRS